MPMLEVKDLHTSFFTPAGEVRAVNGVSFNLDHGKVLGIVGESGSGKSVSAMSILQLLDANGYIESGEIIFEGEDLTKKSLQEIFGEIIGNFITAGKPVILTLEQEDGDYDFEMNFRKTLWRAFPVEIFTR